MQSRIATRFFKATAAILVASTLLLGVSLLFFASQYFRNERQQTLAASIAVASELLQDDYASGGYLNRAALSASFSLISRTSDSVLFLAQSNGQVVLCSEGANCVHTSYTIPKELMTSALREGLVVESGTLSGIYSGPYYTVGMPAITKDGDLIGILFASSSSASLTVFLTDLMSMFLISTGLMLFFSSLLSVWLSQRITQPLRLMATAARAFGQGDFAVRVPASGDDEIAQLALTFNNMAQNLENNEESRSAFVDNIAHELRTPMTSIKGFVDGILDGTIPPEQQGRYLQIVSQEVGRLSRLTRSMLDVSRLESGNAGQNIKAYDIWQTIVSVTLGQEQRIEEKNIAVKGLSPSKTFVLADPDLVYQVVYNLIDNAIKFTPQNGTITLAVTEKGGAVYVSVMNTGSGIAKDDVPYVFDRFYKADKSRGINTAGSGLGLYICKKLLNQSGGDIMVRSKLNVFTQFTFSLPSGSKDRTQRDLEAKKGILPIGSPSLEQEVEYL